MEKHLDIMDLIIQKCIELFEQEQKINFPQDGIDYGTPPKAALITYGFGEMRKVGYQITDVQKKWFYRNGHLEETDSKRTMKREPRSGMYYAEASFNFSIDTDNHSVYLDMCYGPRYARGFKFELEQKENTVYLCNETVLWVT